MYCKYDANNLCCVWYDNLVKHMQLYQYHIPDNNYP